MMMQHKFYLGEMFWLLLHAFAVLSVRSADDDMARYIGYAGDDLPASLAVIEGFGDIMIQGKLLLSLLDSQECWSSIGIS